MVKHFENPAAVMNVTGEAVDTMHADMALVDYGLGIQGKTIPVSILIDGSEASAPNEVQLCAVFLAAGCKQFMGRYESASGLYSYILFKHDDGTNRYVAAPIGLAYKGICRLVNRPAQDVEAYRWLDTRDS